IKYTKGITWQAILQQISKFGSAKDLKVLNSHIHLFS
ncbi:hypothetical protein DBR06_SOUSAS5910005, partial [Sousa chinensis]